MCHDAHACTVCSEDIVETACSKCWDRSEQTCFACKDCTDCKNCLECPRCFDEKNFTSCESCSSHFDCEQCRHFKWAKRYGVQLIGPHAGLEHIIEEVHQLVMTFSRSLCDVHRRRFFLLVGNSEYTSTNYKPLKNPVADVEALEEKLQQPGVNFEVRIVLNGTKKEIESVVLQWTQILPEDAVALVLFCGHGCEVRKKRYFVPVVFDETVQHDTSDDAIVDNAKTNFVEERWVLSRVYRVLRRDGRLISYWDCCRQNHLHKNLEIHRNPHGSFDPLIRGLKVFGHELDEFSSPDCPSEIAVCASSPSDGADTYMHGPLASALLSLLDNPLLTALDITDNRVTHHIAHEIEKHSNFNQKPEFFHDGRAAFSFIDQGTCNDEMSPAVSPPSGSSVPKFQVPKKRPRTKGQHAEGGWNDEPMWAAMICRRHRHLQSATVSSLWAQITMMRLD